jgi:hypothetical protein
MSRISIAVRVGIAGLGLVAAAGAQATTITEWSFSSTVSAPDNSPAPTTGSGTATTLGMTNSYNGGNTESDDVLLTAGTANPSFSEYTWRIRGTANNGWANAAPQDSQGIELDTSTVGYQNISFSFDWYSTTQGIRDLQFQYNTNVNNASGWTDFGGTSATGTYIATSNDYYNAPGSPTITVNLSSIAGANNDPTFGIRLVSAYDSTGNIDGYASAQLLSSGLTQAYNNTSGNWRFDNLIFSGTPVPLPSTVWLMLTGLGGLVGLARRRRA